MDNKIIIKNKKGEDVTIKESELNAIVDNLELVKVIMNIFNGQVLYMDLQEFCLKFRVFNSVEDFKYAIEKLKKAKVLKQRTYPNTSYVIIIAKTCVNKYINQIDDSIDFSSSLVRLNCFKNAVIVRTVVRPNCSIDKFIELLNVNSTILNSKHDIASAYAFFGKYFKLNKIAKDSYNCSMYRSTKGLKSVKTVGTEKDELIGFKNSLDAFVNADIYTFRSGEDFSFYILDISDNLKAEKVGKRIATTVGTIYEQVEQFSISDKLGDIKFVIIARDDVRCSKIIDSFRNTYYKEHIPDYELNENIEGKSKPTIIKAYQEFLVDSINVAIKKRNSEAKINYVDKNKESIGVFEFRNIFETQWGLNISVEVVNAKLNDRINMYTRVANIKQARAKKHEEEIEKKVRRKIEDDIYRNAQALYSAKEDAIREQIMAEYGIRFDACIENDEEEQKLQINSEEDS